jgi:hypothetical protein
MGQRRMLPRRDPPVRAGTVAQCRPEPRRGLAAFADFTLPRRGCRRLWPPGHRRSRRVRR